MFFFQIFIHKIIECQNLHRTHIIRFYIFRIGNNYNWALQRIAGTGDMRSVFCLKVAIGFVPILIDLHIIHAFVGIFSDQSGFWNWNS